MQHIWNFLAANPWIWAVALFGLGIWIAAVWAVVTQSKFRRKWLWGLLSLVSFSSSWQVGPGAFVSVGLPVGALYILWFWRFGPGPTAEQLSMDAARRETNRVAGGSAARLLALRVGYLVAAAATALMAWMMVSGRFEKAIVDFEAFAGGRGLPPVFGPLRSVVVYGDTALVAALIALFVFLSFRPYWWGKLICVWAGLAWTMFGVFASLLFPPWGLIAHIALAAGLIMLVAVIVLQIADPRFGGPYLRKAESA